MLSDSQWNVESVLNRAQMLSFERKDFIQLKGKQKDDEETNMLKIHFLRTPSFLVLLMYSSIYASVENGSKDFVDNTKKLKIPDNRPPIKDLLTLGGEGVSNEGDTCGQVLSSGIAVYISRRCSSFKSRIMRSEVILI